ncbi:hypothetical protein SAM23877_7375 [Streptomyces ambofaciens ATCC 23877]|uniref:Uncharacterized protein n=1 Tax=Streptomyces ambofaciens (strain ATCC 23877 / 3486 / DSM 40053 / JCM 4204 / NBRC 12836 / NRRL B-2516) TaxID=278992 RepID=A0A0K2B5J3_STRA7|nr:hypothetical protein SAM23877_7375 [Streptomyces ambofaciens ATCC 23877]
MSGATPNHAMRRLLVNVGWSPVGLLHGMDEGDLDVFSLRPASACGAQPRPRAGRQVADRQG